MKRLVIISLTVSMILWGAVSLSALVKYDEGSVTVNGVLLLQDDGDPKKYYYVPPYPRVAETREGKLEFLCVKFVDPAGKTSGGLLHFLSEFSLPEHVVEELSEALKTKVPGAKVAGSVRLLEDATDEAAEPSFKVVSAVLSDPGKGMFKHTLITSGHAPLTPGSRSAVASILDQKGATLLFETLEHPTSDISVSIHAYYEAVVRAYNATVTADIGTVYKHFSSVLNKQGGYKKRQLRDITDELIRKSTIKIDVLDRSEGLGVDSKSMDRITKLVTDKIVNLMFDHKTGFSKIPEKETAVEKGQISGRQKKSWFQRTFLGGSGNPEYISDDQYVMKKREDIQQATFFVNLSKRTTIKVPLHTSGNMGGIYTDHKDDEDNFRIVNLADPAFEKREVFFKVDGDYLKSFEDTVNFASVHFRKSYPDRPVWSAELIFDHKAIKNGDIMRPVSYSRLGVADNSWLDYEYRVAWSVYGRETVYTPSSEDEWLTSNAPVLSLVPPFDKTTMELDVELSEFEANRVHSGVVEFRYVLAGKPKQARRGIFRGKDTEQTRMVTVYHDRDTVPEYRVTWHQKAAPGKKTTEWQKVDSTYLYLSPPSFEESDEN